MARRNNFSISAFFPCHNEEGNVERLTRQTIEVLDTISDDYEVIIVNDGSRDRTAEIANRLAAEIPKVRVIHHEVNRGYGGALQSGFRGATREWVFYTDGDGQFDIRELPDLLELTSTHDIVSCYRIDRQDSWIRKLNAWGWGKVVRLTLGLNLRDIDCAFKLYRREIFDRIEMRSNGALIDAEILCRAQRAGYSIVQRGVHHYPRVAGVQSGANLKVIARAFLDLFELRGEIRSTTLGCKAQPSASGRTHKIESPEHPMTIAR
jgi:glycosyltransferase involved in cell wall biosynthesis